MKMKSSYWQGLGVGLLLQLAIGPVLLTIIQAAYTGGFLETLPGVFAVILVDGVYILGAIFGIGQTVLSRAHWQIRLQIFSIGVLVFLAWRLFASGVLDEVATPLGSQLFWYLFWFTLSNPLTLLFWSGIFARELTQRQLAKSETIWFGVGALSATGIFLTFAAAFAGQFATILTGQVQQLLNQAVALCFLFFAVRMTWDLIRNPIKQRMTQFRRYFQKM